MLGKILYLLFLLAIVVLSIIYASCNDRDRETSRKWGGEQTSKGFRKCMDRKGNNSSENIVCQALTDVIGFEKLRYAAKDGCGFVKIKGAKKPIHVTEKCGTHGVDFIYKIYAKDPTKKICMELDGYDEILSKYTGLSYNIKLGFEFQGPHHYIKGIKPKPNDTLKVKIIKEIPGMYLLIINYKDHSKNLSFGYEAYKKYIKDRLIDLFGKDLYTKIQNGSSSLRDRALLKWNA